MVTEAGAGTRSLTLPTFCGCPITGTLLGEEEEGSKRREWKKEARRREGSWEGEREEGRGGTKESQLKGETSALPGFSSIPSKKAFLGEMELPSWIGVCVCVC